MRTHIILADVHAFSVDGESYIYAIIDQKRHIVFLGNFM
jgi:hypothetical protein